MFDSAVLERASAADCGRLPHVLLVVPDQKARYELADMLLEAGFRLTSTSSAGVASTLLDSAEEIDLIVSAAPVGDLRDDALIRRARSVHPGVPVLLLDQDTASGPGVLGLIRQLIDRWSLVPQ